MQGKERVLVVDDEANVRDFARSVLSRNGYEVLEAADGLEALNLMEQLSGQVEVVVTDIKMPGMDGFALADKICSAYPDVRLLFMSGYVSTPARKKPFLPKPFLPAALLKAIQALVL